MATVALAPRPALAPAPDTQALLRALAATLASRPDYASYTPPDALGPLAGLAPSDADCDLPAPLDRATYITHLDTIRRAGALTQPRPVPGGPRLARGRAARAAHAGCPQRGEGRAGRPKKLPRTTPTRPPRAIPGVIRGHAGAESWTDAASAPRGAVSGVQSRARAVRKNRPGLRTRPASMATRRRSSFSWTKAAVRGRAWATARSASGSRSRSSRPVAAW